MIVARWASLSRINEGILGITTDSPMTLMAIEQKMAIMKPGAVFSEAYLDGQWDGKFYPVRQSAPFIPIGIWGFVKDACEELGIELYMDIDITTFYDADFQGGAFKTKFLPLIYTNDRIEKRDYQIRCMGLGLYMRRGIIRSCTGSGKTFILYAIIRYIRSTYPNLNCLLIVPNINLVTQMFREFEDYGWVGIQSECSILYGDAAVKREFNPNAPIIISTFQSLAGFPMDWYARIGALFIDETHRAKAATIQTIAQFCINAIYRIGLTGSLPRSMFDRLQVHANLGPVIAEVRSAELIAAGVLPEVTINVVAIQYSDDVIRGYKAATKKIKDVEDPMTGDISVGQKGGVVAGNKYIRNHPEHYERLIRSMVGKIEPDHNTLILCATHEEVANYKSAIKKFMPDRKLMVVTGKVKGDTRDKIFETFGSTPGAIIVATYETMSTGISINRIHHVILGTSKRDSISILQSIGRALRRLPGKSRAHIWDFFSFLPPLTGNPIPADIDRLVDRLEVYLEEEFPVENFTIYPGTTTIADGNMIGDVETLIDNVHTQREKHDLELQKALYWKRRRQG